MRHTLLEVEDYLAERAADPAEPAELVLAHSLCYPQFTK